MNKSIQDLLSPWLGLISAVIGSIGGVIVASPNWDNVLTTGGIGGMLMALGGALASWASPLPNEAKQKIVDRIEEEKKANK